jgi:23S rRNA (uracil1939-C5)-methyltransferase
MRRRARRYPEGEHRAEILDLAEDGRGVARINGKVVFIADSLPGEIVRFRYVAAGKSFDEGQTVAVDSASPDRVEPGCAHFGVCGGCALQHLAPAAQVRFKQKQLLDALQRIGGVQPGAVAPPVTGPVWGYRRRARLGAKLVFNKDKVLVGFRERRTHFLAELQRCPVLDPRVGEQLETIAAALARTTISNRIPQIEMAAADHVCLSIRVLAPPTDGDLEVLRSLAADTGFEIRLQPGGLDSITPLNPPEQTLAYSPDGSSLQLQFRIADFIQVNGYISQQVVRQAINWLAPVAGERVLELFCGLGNFSLPLARHGVDLTAVEGDTGLVARARDNAQRAGLAIRFEKADLFKTGPEADWFAGDFDAVLLDPPRSGAEAMMPLIAAKRPSRIVYVSCQPGTLARDVGLLTGHHGYRLARAGVMDMFPHTAHVESMALLVRDDQAIR